MLLPFFLGVIVGSQARAEPTPVERLKAEAAALGPIVETPLAKAFLKRAGELPEIGGRTVYYSRPEQTYLSPVEAAKRPDFAELQKVELKPGFYYTTKYGTPLAYARVLDLAAKAGLPSLDGRMIMDFGYGTIGHLRLMALHNGHAVGVDVDSLLPALYAEPGDTGAVGESGSVRIVNGFFPTDPAIKAQVGAGYHLITSKNTLKRGYIHPEREADKRFLIDLGVDDATFLGSIFSALEPGGLFVVYNLSPAQNPPDKPFLPMADGRFPFLKADVEKAGFEVVVFDQVDDLFARQMAAALGWYPAGADLEKTLFAHATVLRRPATRTGLQ